MSLLNTWVSPTRALVAVDTTGQAVQDGTLFEMSKMIPLVHANTVIAVRGSNLLLQSVFTSCLLFQGDGHFDVLTAWLPKAIDDQFEAYVAGSIATFWAREEDLRCAEIVLVGYSRSGKEVAGLTLRRELNDRAFTAKKIAPWTMAPGADWGPQNHPKVPDSIENMIDAARYQVQHVRKDTPDFPIGGRLIIAELTRDSMRIRSVADLG